MRSRSKNDSKKRYITAEVKRSVYERDAGMCTQCGAIDNLQFHHRLPLFLGGESTFDNLKLLCSECHRYTPDHNGITVKWKLVRLGQFCMGWDAPMLLLTVLVALLYFVFK